MSRFLMRIIPVILSVFMLSADDGMRGQTCRVVLESPHTETKTYMDVFEYGYVSVKPKFPGGDSKLVEFVNRERRYPEEAYRRGIQGRVMCSFIVMTDGKVSNVRVIKSVEKSLDEEAVRILSQMPDWEPGLIDGRQVAVRVVRSVPFRK